MSPSSNHKEHIDPEYQKFLEVHELLKNAVVPTHARYGVDENGTVFGPISYESHIPNPTPSPQEYEPFTAS